MTIKVLDGHTVSHIAAGEVVARPASVVKELVENSLDADASRIRIEVEEGGRTLVEVTDDGHGMTPQELALSLERHATSKIESHRDLPSISSYGFRGEALPSIAAVSRLEISSRPRGSEGGWILRAEGGRIQDQGPRGMPVGTRVSIRDLFFNTPARRKQLKSPTAELRHVFRLATGLALARPAVSLEVCQGSSGFATSGRGDLRETYLEIYGAEKARRMRVLGPVKSGGRELWGLLGTADMAAGTRAGQWFFINGRPVTVPVMARALSDGLRGHAPGGGHIPAVLHLWVPPELVDANVHPAKTEVRLEEEDQIYRMVRQSVEGAVGPVPRAYFRVGDPSKSISSPAGEISATEEPTPISQRPAENHLHLRSQSERSDTFPRPLGVIFDTYIVAREGDRAYLIDQHAASERVIYDRLREQREKSQVESQSLIAPLRLELAAEEWEVYRENQEAFRALGFSAEPFGERTLLLRSVPQGTPERAFRDILNILSEGGRPRRSPEETMTLHLAACRRAVMAGQKLSMGEMEELLRQLMNTRNPRTCPHGRPTMVEIPRQQVDRWFDR